MEGDREGGAEGQRDGGRERKKIKRERKEFPIWIGGVCDRVVIGGSVSASRQTKQ